MSRRLKCTIVITRCPSSVVCLSVVNFSHFRLLKNHWTYFDETLQDASPRRPLPSLCFFVPIGHPRWPPRPLIGWNIFRLLLRNRWMDFDKTWQEVSPQRPLPSLCFSSRSVIQDDRQEVSPQRPLPSLCFSSRSVIFKMTGLWFAKRKIEKVPRGILTLLKHFSTSLQPPSLGKGVSLTKINSYLAAVRFKPLGCAS